MMKQVISKTFGGLTKQYYIRQFLFGLIFPVFIIYFSLQGTGGIKFLPFIIASTFLYPYSRFVYESIVDYIVGDHVFWLNAIILLSVKFLTMAICWMFAILIAPAGLAYLYYYHSKQEQTE